MFEPQLEATKIAAHFLDIAVLVLREANCSLPLSFSCTVNNKGSVTLLVDDRLTPASAYKLYFAHHTSRLNKASLVGNTPGKQFKPAPNKTILLMHSILLDLLLSQIVTKEGRFHMTNSY